VKNYKKDVKILKIYIVNEYINTNKYITTSTITLKQLDKSALYSLGTAMGHLWQITDMQLTGPNLQISPRCVISTCRRDLAMYF